MGVVEFVNDKGEQDTFSINDKLLKNVAKIKERVNKKDFDQVFLIDGPEGSGKSVFGMQLGKAFDETLSLERICLTPSQFVSAIQNSQKGQVVIYDEAYTGLASRQSLSEINKLIVSMMMEMRAKNLIVIIILPTFFMLDKYVAIFRSKGLFHVYTNKGRRGYWLYYNSKKKKLLYIFGKKLMNYNQPKVKFRGNFYGKYVLNEEDYRKKKDYALKNRESKAAEDKARPFMEYFIYILHKEYKVSFGQMEEMAAKVGLSLGKTTAHRIYQNISEKVDKRSVPGAHI